MIHPTVSLFGFSVYAGTRQDLIDTVLDPACPIRRLAYLNAHAVVLAERDHTFRAALASADLLVADGRSILWTARLSGRLIKEPGTGSLLCGALLESGARAGHRILLAGYDPDLLHDVERHCRSRIPSATFLPPALFPDPFPPHGEDLLAAHMDRHAADMLFLGLGSPHQERVLSRIPSSTLAVCVGASFSYYTGHLSRPPAFLATLGLEWAWRFLHEPRRLWRRYLLGLPRFAVLAVRFLLSSR